MESHNHIKFSRTEIIAKERGYSVSDDGTFYSSNNNEIEYIDPKGYKRCTIMVHGRNVALYAHRLQAYQKYGESIYSKGILVRHLDGNKTNNNIENIALGNHRDNMMDVDEKIRRKRASKAARQTIKHNRDEVVEYHYGAAGGSRKKTMEHFGITSTGTLHYILNHRKFNDKV
jgi:hypothetical protein